MVTNINRGVNNKLLTKNSGHCKNNKINFSANPLAALGPEKLMNKIPDSWWQKISNKIPERLFAGNFAKKVLDTASHNASLLEASFVLALCSSLRPGTIMATPGAPIDDRKYAAAKSIASGIIGFVLTAAIFIPIAAATKNLGKLASEGLLKNGFPKQGSPKYQAFEYLSTYAPRFIVAPLEAVTLFAMVPPIVHKLLNKKNKQAAAPLPSQPKTPIKPNIKGSV